LPRALLFCRPAAPPGLSPLSLPDALPIFVATGIVWRWLMNSGTGERAVGLNRLFDWLGLPQWQWFRDPDWGMAAMALPAIWQMSDRKSTRLNSSHVKTSYAVFCLKKQKHR